MKKRKTYSKEFKEKAIRLVKEDGLTCIQVERDLGIGRGTVSKWIRNKNKFKDDIFCESGNVHLSEREFKSLQKELVSTKRELEMLKKSNRQMSSFEKARKWRRLSVFDGRHLKERWGAEILDMVDEPLLKDLCGKYTYSNDDVCRSNSWTVESLLELTRLVGALQNQNPRCLLWFRGERNRHLNATPKACRSDKEWDDFLEMTKWFNCNAGKGRLFNNRGELARWAILQHYGAPTPLLDITTSLRIATVNAIQTPTPKTNKEGKLDWIKDNNDPNLSVFATPRPLDGINIFAEADLCLVDLVAELPSHCLRPHIQRAGFLGLTDIVMDGLDYCKKRPLKEEANLDCVRIAKIYITKTDDFEELKIDHVFPPASKYTTIGFNRDDMSGDYLLRALHDLNESSALCPLKKVFPNHYWEGT